MPPSNQARICKDKIKFKKIKIDIVKTYTIYLYYLQQNMAQIIKPRLKTLALT